MSRTVWGMAGTLTLALTTMGAQAADTYVGHDPSFRPAYNLQWQDEYEDSLTFELGLRYWYSHGSLNVGPHWANDTTQAGELHFRIDDASTATYARGHLGYGAVIDGTYGSPLGGGAYTHGRLAYARADLGYNLYQDDHATASLFAGYAYSNQEGHDGAAQVGLDIHALRLGISGRAQLGHGFDIYAEAAVMPFAWAHAYGAYGPGDGSLYGYSGEVLVGFEPGPNVLVRGGLRAEYLSGPLTMNAPATTYSAEQFRWGPLIELTYAF